MVWLSLLHNSIQQAYTVFKRKFKCRRLAMMGISHNSWLVIRLNVFCWLNSPQEQFIFITIMTYSVSPTQIFSKGPELVLTTAVEPPEYLLTGRATLLLDTTTATTVCKASQKNQAGNQCNTTRKKITS